MPPTRSYIKNKKQSFMDKFRLYGLIGYPVSHSYSPYMHNAAFKKLKLKAAYVLFPVRPAAFGSDFKRVLGLNVQGLNVTIPHKERVIRYLDKVTREAKLIGAVNTIAVSGKRLIGHNTDGKGFVKALKVETGTVPKGKRVFMLGAGGAAKAVGFELALNGASSLAICDIFENKARKLASSIKRHTRCAAKAISPRDKKGIGREVLSSDILVNATPCGMKKGDTLPIDKKLLRKGLVVCDLIYNPPATPLIKEARKRKLKAMNGLGMLLYQGALSFGIWTGRPAPVDVMKKALQAKIHVAKI